MGILGTFRMYYDDRLFMQYLGNTSCMYVCRRGWIMYIDMLSEMENADSDGAVLCASRCICGTVFSDGLGGLA